MVCLSSRYFAPALLVPLPLRLMLPFRRRSLLIAGTIFQKVAHAIRQQNSIKIVPSVPKKHVNLLLPTRKTRTSQEIVETQTSSCHQVNTVVVHVGG